VHDSIEEEPWTHVLHVVPDAFDAAHFRERPPAGFLRRRAACLVTCGARGNPVHQLAIQVALDRVSMQQCAERGTPPGQHGFSSPYT
jgi:hypothetical protein